MTKLRGYARCLTPAKSRRTSLALGTLARVLEMTKVGGALALGLLLAGCGDEDDEFTVTVMLSQSADVRSSYGFDVCRSGTDCQGMSLRCSGNAMVLGNAPFAGSACDYASVRFSGKPRTVTITVSGEPGGSPTRSEHVSHSALYVLYSPGGRCETKQVD